MIKKIFTSLTFLVVGLFAVSNVFAEEITVSNNGSGSSNDVQIANSSSSTVEQTNNADIQNNVDTSANTGDNSVSSNNADANITTGNIESSSTVSNENINTNFAENQGCGCSGNTTAAIDGNGSDSINNLNLTFANTTNISQANSAQITNNSTTNSNTGNNQANNNNGDVAIQTGNITSLISILNKNINLNSDPQGSNNNSISISINNNGSGSIDSIVMLFSNSLNYISNNFADIENNVLQNLNTGINTANNNNGAVLIATGDIISVITIGNENINSSFFKQQCCPNIIPPPGGGNPQPIEDPVGALPPSSGSSSGGSGSSVGGPGQVLGAAIGNVLPATGAYWILLMTILAITMFLTGGFLRFGSDPSPPLAYAV